MTGSKNTEYTPVFDRMIDTEKRKAFIERRKNSYNSSKEENAKLEEYIMSDQCTEELRRLRSGDFFFEPPQRIMLRKKNSTRRRTIYRFRDNESMILKLMSFVMHDFDYLYTDSLYSFRIGRHISEIFRMIKKNGYSGDKWMLKADIHSFGDNVDPDMLTAQLAEIFEEDDPALYAFLSALLTRGEYYDRGRLEKGTTGALSGCALTNFFENVYLLDMDDTVRERSVYYCRFADDIAIFTETGEAAAELREILRHGFSRRGLEFNEGKTQIYAPGEAFDLLGFRVENGEFDIADNSIEKIEWKLNHFSAKLVKWYRKGEITKEEAMRKMIGRIDSYFFGKVREENELSWVDWSFSVLTRADSLRRLDACSQDCIRFAGSGGKSGGARYRVRYKDMQRMGYRTLVHAYYHGFERDEK